MKRAIASLLLAVSPTISFAVTNSEVFAFAAANYSSLFSGTPTTGQYLQYSYAYFPTTQNYLAVDTTGTVHMLGPATNNQISAVGPLSSFEPSITSWASKTTQKFSAACNSASAPTGISYSQSGNTITVATNGCISVPTSGYCSPSVTQSTGENILMTAAVKSFNFSGISLNLPAGFPNPLNSAASSIGNTSACIKNAPSDFSSLTINTNVCFDVTQQLASSISALQATGMVSVTSPVTISLQSTSTMKSVADCSTSGANTITDALTGKTTVKQADGTYK